MPSQPTMSFLSQAFYEALALDCQRHMVLPLRSLLMVGAKLNEAGELSANDTAYFFWAFHALHRAGIPVSPDFTVDTINMDPVHGGEDFLTGDYRADILMACWMYDPLIHEKQYISSQGACMSSSQALIRGIWYEKAVAAQAKAICTVGGVHEVNHKDFEGPAYEVLSQGFIQDKPSHLLVDRRYINRALAI